MPDVAAVERQIATLVKAGEGEALNELRARAAAQALYERQHEHIERERAFSRLRLITEAALGVVSYDVPDVIPSNFSRSGFRALASAYERGALMEVAGAAKSLTTVNVVNECRRRGYTHAPLAFFNESIERAKRNGVYPHIGHASERQGSLPWSEARRLAAELDIPLSRVPIDGDAAAMVAETNYRRSDDMKRLWKLREKASDVERRKRVAVAARERGPAFDNAYALLRRTLQALDSAQSEMLEQARRGAMRDRPIGYVEDKKSLDRAFAALYQAEEELVAILRVERAA